MQRHPVLGILFVFFLLVPTWSVVTVQAQGGNIMTFSDGTSQHTVTVSAGMHTPIGIELQRNTTVTSSTFFISPDQSSSSAGIVELDVNQDGSPEWSFNQTGYGYLGHQTMFASGNFTDSIFVDPFSSNYSTPYSPSIYLPAGATFSEASLDVEFSPELAGGFFQTGFVDDAAVGDINGDSRDDFVMFSKSANLSTNASTFATGTGFSIMSYSNSTGITTTNWTSTCSNATELMVADLNGDTYDDVINYAPADDLLCLHFVNSTTGVGFDPQINVTHASSIIALDFGDFTGNGVDEMVSIRSNGVVSVDDFSNRSNSFSNRDSVTVYNPNGQTKAVLTHMALDYFMIGLTPSLMAISEDGDGTHLFWATNSNSIATDTQRISGVAMSVITGDFDSDGDIDILSATPDGHRSFENRYPNGWDADNHGRALELTNATILDYDLDGSAHLLLPEGTPDGNPATFDGNFTAYEFVSSGNSQNRVRSLSSDVLEPWTSPRAMYLGDLDGDSFREHLVLAGEGSQFGVFVSAWHTVGYDFDHDDAVDVEAEGYAGNGSNGLAPLSIIDYSNNLTIAMNALSQTWPSVSDAYRIQMAEVNISMSTLSIGEFMFSGLDFEYTTDFLVDTNPSLSGNLSNALNQQMTAGSGAFTVFLDFTATQNGSFLIHTPTIAFQDGAPNIALPPTPSLNQVELLPNRVAISWQNTSDFGDDLIEFAVYRSVTGQPADLQNVYLTSPSNFTIDENVQPGDTWTYWVRSIHSYGVTSNLSLPFDVTVPYPVPKSYIPNVTASDVPEDEGGHLSIAWDQGDASVVEHRIYIESYAFSSIGNLTTVHAVNANNYTVEVDTDGAGAALIDGTPYHVAVVGFDEFGNASMNVTSLGPVYSRNDTALLTTLEMHYSGFADDENFGQVLLARSEGLEATAHLHLDGVGVAGADVQLHVVDEGDQYTLSAFTNTTGHATFSIAALSDLGDIEAIGFMTLKATYNGSEGDELQRPLMAASNTTDAFGTVVTEFNGPSPIPLDDTLAFDLTLNVLAKDATQQSALSNLIVGWSAYDANGTEVSFGIGEVQGDEMNLAGNGTYDGELVLVFDTSQPFYYVPGMELRYAFASPPTDQTNQTNQTNQTTGPTFPDVTLPATVECGTATYEWDSNATDVLITCTVSNPNPFDVLVDFSWKVIPGTPPPIELVWNQADGPSVTAKDNDTVDLTFRLVRNAPTEGMFPGTQGEGYVLHLTCLDFGDNACDAMTEPMASTEGEIVWTLGEMPMVDGNDLNLPQDEASSAMTPVLVGIGLVIAVGAAIAGVLFLRRDLEVEFDEDDEDDYYAMAMDQPASRSETVAPLDLGAKKSLDELKGSGKDLHEAAPEGLASSPALGSSADAFEFGATAEDHYTSEAEEEGDEERADEEDNHDGDDDGITVDEDGTEWWEDEEGVWWYREEGWEDWAVWED